MSYTPPGEECSLRNPHSDYSILKPTSFIINFAFTLNNWTETEYDSLKKYIEMNAKWGIIGKEIAPSTGTPHLQCAICLTKNARVSTIKNYPGFKRTSLLARFKGTPQQNRKYCSKDGDFWEYGQCPEKTKGRRTDLESVHDMVKKGKSHKQIMNEYPCVWYKYNKSISQAKQFYQTEERTPPHILWIYGPTGTGKTRFATDLVSRDQRWFSKDGLKWFNGYVGQKVAVLDDFRSNQCTFTFLLRLLDRYEYEVEYKGGFVDWTPSVIIITTTLSMLETFRTRNEHLPEDIRQLERRVTHEIQFPISDNELEELLQRTRTFIPTQDESEKSSGSVDNDDELGISKEKETKTTENIDRIERSTPYPNVNPMWADQDYYDESKEDEDAALLAYFARKSGSTSDDEESWKKKKSFPKTPELERKRRKFK